MRKDRVALEHHAALGIGFGGQRPALEPQFALAGPLLAEQQPQKGGLAAARGAHQRAELAFGDTRVQLFEHDLVAMALPDVANLDETHGALPRTRKHLRWIRRNAQSIAQARSVIQAT